MGQWGAIDVPQLGSGAGDLERGTLKPNTALIAAEHLGKNEDSLTRWSRPWHCNLLPIQAWTVYITALCLSCPAHRAG